MKRNKCFWPLLEKVVGFAAICIFYACVAEAQTKPPPIRTPTSDAAHAIEKKAAELNLQCKGLRDAIPVKIKSSTGADGYYAACNENNAVIFYIPSLKKAILNGGLIREKYASQDFERGPLGFPVSDAGFTFSQTFENGIIAFGANTFKSVFIIKGDIYTAYKTAGGSAVTGRPSADEVITGGVRSQDFEKGRISQTGASFAFKPVTQSHAEASILKGGSQLAKNIPFWSQDKRYDLIFQEDGNLVLYKGSAAIWSSHTNGVAVKTCIFQSDGNLVLYGYNGKAVWNSGSNVTSSEWKNELSYMALVLQNDGNLVVYGAKKNGGSVSFWSTKTEEKN